MTTATIELGVTEAAPHYGTADVDKDSIEALRHILTAEQHRDVGYDETREIADSLIELFQVLAEAGDEPEV